MENKQTAVEWLVDKLMKAEFINNPEELVEKAKEMEKEQIMDAYDSGEANNYAINFLENREDVSPEKFYNTTYGK